MNNAMRQQYARLLRWYPKGWREEHGRMMLDTLEEHAHDRGIARLGLAEAWSIRSHGLGERATNRWAVTCAAISLGAFILAAAILFSDARPMPGIGTVRTILAVLVGPLALTFAIVVLQYRKGRLSAPESLCTALGAVPAFVLASVASEALSMGFQEADAGGEGTWFGSAALLFVALAWLAGALALSAPVFSIMNRNFPEPIRWLLTAVVAGVFSLILGILVVTAGQMLGSLAAAAALLVATLADRSPAAGHMDLSKREPPRPQFRPSGLGRDGYLAIGAAALFSLLLGLGCAAFALGGSKWVGGVRDSTHAMNLGLAAGALVALPAMAALSVLLLPRFGPVMRASGALACAGLVTVAIGQFLGAGHSLQWPLILLAAVLVGFALAAPVGRIMSANPGLRIAATVGLGLAGSLVGLYFVTAAAFIIPFLAAGLLFWAIRRLVKGRPSAGLAGSL